MTVNPRGPDEVRPNTLREQPVPNTLRGMTQSGAYGSGAGPVRPAASRRRARGFRIPLWAITAALVLAVILAVLLTRGAL